MRKDKGKGIHNFIGFFFHFSIQLVIRTIKHTSHIVRYHTTHRTRQFACYDATRA